MSLGERIKEIRKDNSITQNEFAQRMLVSASYISKVEAGKEQPSEIFLKLMSLEFGISLEWLKNGEGFKQLIKDQHDYFERNNNYNNDIIKSIIDFQKIINTLPKDIDASIYFMLREYTHILKSEHLSESQKTLIASIIADILANIMEMIDKFFTINKKDDIELFRFQQFFSEISVGVLEHLNEIKNVLVPQELD